MQQLNDTFSFPPIGCVSCELTELDKLQLLAAKLRQGAAVLGPHWSVALQRVQQDGVVGDACRGVVCCKQPADQLFAPAAPTVCISTPWSYVGH